MNRHHRTDRLTLGRHMARISQITLVTALAMIALIVIVGSFVTGLFSIVDANRTKAKVLAASASLMFQDAGSAGELLKSLSHTPDVHGAAIYGDNLRQFASYLVEGQGAPESLPAAQEDTIYGIRKIELKSRH